MSRIGKQPVVVSSDIAVSLEGTVLVFKKGSVQKQLDTRGNVGVEIQANQVVFSPLGEERENRAYWGTYRSLAQNIITGLTSGFEKKLEINGVGYRAAVNGAILELQLGFSHPIKYEYPKGLVITVEKNVLTIRGDDKQVVGQVAAEIRGFRPPEPYKGKGVKYVGEHIIRKAGKTSKK